MTTEIDEATALLIRARGFLERGWCRGAQARDADGWQVSPTSGDAVAWCAFGAMVAAGGNFPPCFWGQNPTVVRLQAAIGGEDIAVFNNRQETVEPVLAAFDRAIAGEPMARVAGSEG
jgi:hypothetical protein